MVNHLDQKRENQKRMNRKAYILLLLFFSWPVNNLFRFFDIGGIHRPFVFNVEEVDMDWYLWHIGGSLSYIMIFWGCWLYMQANYRKDRDIITLFSVIVINQISDIIHYIGWQRHCEPFIVLQGFNLLVGALLILERQLKKRYGTVR